MLATCYFRTICLLICYFKIYIGQNSDKLHSRGSIPSTGKILHYSTPSRLTLGATQPPIQWIMEAFSLGLKQQRHEADHSPPAGAKVKKGGAIPLLPQTSL
jgi:hypothetical protein